MKILQLISSGGMYGAEAVILSLMRELKATGEHRCTLAIFGNPEQAPPALYEAATRLGFGPEEVVLLPCRGQLDLGVGARLRELAADAAVLHAHGYKADIYAAFAWKGSRPALVSTCHTWYDNDLAVRIYGALDRWTLRRFEKVVAVSGEVRDRLLAAGVRADRVELIRNGVAMETFAGAGRLRQERQAGEGALRIGLVGRLAPEKGIDVFLRAAFLLLKEYPGLQFEVAGEGPERVTLESEVRSYHMEGNFALTGSHADMSSFYAGLDILVSASRQEGLPVALLEGAATGLPIVATRVGAVAEIVVPEVTGLLVDPGDAEALAAAIRRLVEDRGLRASLGGAAQGRVATEFSARRMAEDYLRAYRAALATQAERSRG